LTDGPSIAGIQATLGTNQHQVVDDDSIPTGAIEPYPNITANQSFELGPKEPDIDHCFIMETDATKIPLDTRPQSLKMLASFFHPETKLHLEVHSTEPAFQFYTGKSIDVPEVPSEGIKARGARSGFCVEPSRYVNAVNTEKYKHMVLLKKGEKWGSRNVYRAWQD